MNPIVNNFIKQAVASNEDILLAASKYYDNDDPEDPKRRWDHVLDDIEVAKKIRGRDLTPVELGTLAFHDSGYKNPKGYMWGLKNHPKLSRKILLKEAPGLGFKDDEIKHMAKVISYHMRTPKKGSPLLKDDLQMLMFGADEGTPKKPVDDARKYFMKAVQGRYPEVPDKSDPQFIKKLVERVRTFKDYSNAPGLEYYHRVYPNYHRDLYNYWHSDQIIKDYEKMLEDEKKGKSLKQKSEKKKNVKKASVDISDIVNAYKEQYGFDLSHMKGKHSKKPRYNNGKIAKDIPVESYGGSWAKDNTIYLNPDMDAVAKYYGLDNTDDLRKTIVAHELAHEIYNKQATKEYIKKIVDEAKKKKFTTAYLKTVPDRKIDEETFCEYLANGLNKKAKAITFPEEEIASLIGKNKLYTTRVSKDYNKYKLGDTVKAPWGDKYTIDSEDIYDDILKHKFYDELTEEQKKELKKYKRMKLLGLSKKASKLYTYVDPEADLSKGLLSVKLAPEDVLLRRYSAIVKDLKNKNKDAIIKHFEDPGYGPRRTDLIFALDAPIPDNANEGLLRFRAKNKLVSWDPEKVKDLISVVRRRHSPKRLEEVPANFEPLKHVQWGRKPKDSNKAFLYAPAYKVLTESGKIPPELLTIEN